jgi:hypothetical protein
LWSDSRHRVRPSRSACRPRKWSSDRARGRRSGRCRGPAYELAIIGEAVVRQRYDQIRAVGGQLLDRRRGGLDGRGEGDARAGRRQHVGLGRPKKPILQPATSITLVAIVPAAGRPSGPSTLVPSQGKREALTRSAKRSGPKSNSWLPSTAMSTPSRLSRPMRRRGSISTRLTGGGKPSLGAGAGFGVAAGGALAAPSGSSRRRRPAQAAASVLSGDRWSWPASRVAT